MGLTFLDLLTKTKPKSKWERLVRILDSQLCSEESSGDLE